jgi:hypothetical protein
MQNENSTDSNCKTKFTIKGFEIYSYKGYSIKHYTLAWSQRKFYLHSTRKNGVIQIALSSLPQSNSLGYFNHARSSIRNVRCWEYARWFPIPIIFHLKNTKTHWCRKDKLGKTKPTRSANWYATRSNCWLQFFNLFTSGFKSDVQWRLNNQSKRRWIKFWWWTLTVGILTTNGILAGCSDQVRTTRRKLGGSFLKMSNWLWRDEGTGSASLLRIYLEKRNKQILDCPGDFSSLKQMSDKSTLPGIWII